MRRLSCFRSLRVLAVTAALAAFVVAPLTTRAEDEHVVEWGETIEEIAWNYGVDVVDLMRLNGIAHSDDIIYPGDYLILPSYADSWSYVEEDIVQGAPAEDDVWINPPYVDPDTIRTLLIQAAVMYGWDPSLILAQAYQESRWRHDGISHAGAIGVMQVLPETAAEVGDWYLGREVDPVFSVWDNIESGVAFLTILYEATGDVETALAAYYQGLGSLERDGYFPDTHEYVDLIWGFQSDIENGYLP